jgi:GNAT superfamily N-acetyltransferase
MKQGTDDRIQRLSTEALPESMASAVRELCDLAYDSPTAPYFAAIGPGEHLLGWEAGVLVSHLMWVTRWLRMGDDAPLRTAYVEMVATAAAFQGQGRATALLQYFPSQVEHFDLATLARPARGAHRDRIAADTRRAGHGTPAPTKSAPEFDPAALCRMAAGGGVVTALS